MSFAEPDEIVEIVEIEPELTREHISPSRYRRQCDRLERCYSSLENETPYRVTVRPARAGKASGIYYRQPNGNLQILGYSLEIPEDLQDLREAAWERFCSAKRI